MTLRNLTPFQISALRSECDTSRKTYLRSRVTLKDPETVYNTAFSNGIKAALACIVLKPEQDSKPASL